LVLSDFNCLHNDKKNAKKVKRGVYNPSFLWYTGLVMKEKTMSYVSYKNRTSPNYRFTCDSLGDIAIKQLKDMIKEHNKIPNRINKKLGFKKYKTLGLRIRPRGPRVHRYAKDTPWENATRYDVYIREYTC
jgi:hypothetical protein